MKQPETKLPRIFRKPCRINDLVENAKCTMLDPGEKLVIFEKKLRALNRGIEPLRTLRPLLLSLSFNAVDIGAFEAGSTLSVSNVSLRISVVNHPTRYYGAIGVLTNSVTGEKSYGVMNPFGRIGFRIVTGDVYVFELKSKRAGLFIDPVLISVEAVGSFGEVRSCGQLVLEEMTLANDPVLRRNSNL